MPTVESDESEPGLTACEVSAAPHDDRLDGGVGQHSLRHLERELRRAFDVFHRRAIERVVANHRDVDIGLREGRCDQCGRGVADLVGLLVEFERRLREVPLPQSAALPPYPRT